MSRHFVFQNNVPCATEGRSTLFIFRGVNELSILFAGVNELSIIFDAVNKLNILFRGVNE